jgi:hypothetical protein
MLLSVAQKVYLRCLMSSRLADPLYRDPYVECKGGVVGCRAEHTTLFLSNLLYQASKWNVDLVVLKIDLSRAYARISHYHLGRALDAAGIDASLSSALLTELCFLEPAVCVRGVGTSPAFPMHKGLTEGSPAAGALLGILLQAVFRGCRFVEEERLALRATRRRSGSARAGGAAWRAGLRQADGLDRRYLSLRFKRQIRRSDPC